MRIVFMGTPEFAVPCLVRLVEDGNEVAGVFSQQDKPVGRKQVLTAPPVKAAALERGIEVFQPRSMRDGEALKILKGLEPELIVVTAFGKILPPEILDYPRLGCINIHASLLPKYRGAAPIQWAVINGERTAGVTSMQMDAGIDTGNMLLHDSVCVGENETSGELQERLAQLGAEVLSKTLRQLGEGRLHPKKQDEALSCYAPMLDKTLSPVSFNDSAQTVHNKIRGLSPWPSATCRCGGRLIKLHRSTLSTVPGGKTGEVVENEGRLTVSCGDGKCVDILEMQSEGKQRLAAADFLRGFKIDKGTILE